MFRRKENEPLLKVDDGTVSSRSDLAVWQGAGFGKMLLNWEPPFGDRGWEYRTYFRIGMEWLDKDTALVVTPKCGMEGLDWASMFARCFETEEGCEDGLGKIFGVDLDAPPIPDSTMRNVLTPLIVFNFIGAVRRLVRRGLKRDTVTREENLHKVRGRIPFGQNYRRNVVTGRADRVYCRYAELSVDIPENRLIKRALVFSECICRRMCAQRLINSEILNTHIRQCLAAFSAVVEDVSFAEILQHKRNKLFREYDVAIRLAKMILRRYENSMDKASEKEHQTPPFWIDMSLLYEHYVLGLLREAYGNKIVYQAGVLTGYPDFLYVDDQTPMILDTKYKPKYENGRLVTDDIRQLAGYARDRSVLGKLGVSGARQEAEMVPCVVIYPSSQRTNGVQFAFNSKKTPVEQSSPVDELVKFHLLRVELPVVSNITSVN